MCRTSFVQMKEEKSKNPAYQQLQKMYPAYTKLIINTCDENNVYITQNTANQCGLLSSYEQDMPTVQEIKLSISSQALRQCDKLLRNINHVDDIHTIQYSIYSFQKIQELYWACDYLEIPINIQDRILKTIVYMIHPSSNFNSLDQKLVNRIFDKTKNGFLMARFVSSYCRKHSEFIQNDACVIEKKLKEIDHIYTKYNSHKLCKSECGAFEYIFNWEKNNHQLQISIKSLDFGIIFEGTFKDKKCEKLIIGEFKEKLCIVLRHVIWQGMHQDHCSYKALVIDFKKHYNNAQKHLLQISSNNIDTCIYHLVEPYSFISCDKALQKNYTEAEFRQIYG